LETNGRKFNCTVGEYLRQTIRRLKESGKYGSASKHQSLLTRLSQFRSPNIRFEEIEFAYLQDFEFFLCKAGNTDNSIATKFSVFHADLQQGAGGRTLCAESQSVRKVQNRSALDGHS
ncbi:phage integrase SAM-like domain-containing protein, partial [Alistipes ihumii]|uniref:phage integrase SAM-like domain-containing protein n=1 Tax=Alistipes ihumii TaxID=1470347 RepID=UPI003AF5F9F9